MCGCGVQLRCGNLARELRASWTNFNLVLPDFTHLRDKGFESKTTRYRWKNQEQ